MLAVIMAPVAGRLRFVRRRLFHGRCRNRFIAFLLFLSLLPFPSLAGAADHPVHVYLDGKKVEFDAAPYLVDGSVMVPITQYGELLGTNVTWRQQAQTVVVSKNGDQLEFPVGQALAFVNHREQQMEVPTRMVGEAAFVPLRFVSEALGCQVGWEDRSNTVVVSCVPKKQVKVTRIIDGQTIAVDWDGEEKRLRLLGTFNLERYTEKYKDVIRKTVLDYIKERLEGKIVWVELPDEQGKYNLPFPDTEAYVYDPGGNMINAALLDQGLVGGVGYPLNHRWYRLFKDLSDKAYHRKIGFQRSEFHELAIAQSDYVKIAGGDFAEGIISIGNTEEWPNDIGGWTLANAKGDKSFTFPSGFILGGLNGVSVLSGNWAKRVMNDKTRQYGLMLIWTTEPVWNPDGDTAILYDNEGYEISRFEYPQH